MLPVPDDDGNGDTNNDSNQAAESDKSPIIPTWNINGTTAEYTQTPGVLDLAETPEYASALTDSAFSEEPLIFSEFKNNSPKETQSSSEKLDLSEQSHVVVTLRSIGLGSICYFRDRNCDFATADLLFLFCQA